MKPACLTGSRPQKALPPERVGLIGAYSAHSQRRSARRSRMHKVFRLKRPNFDASQLNTSP
jgi:hypothetical protein